MSLIYFLFIKDCQCLSPPSDPVVESFDQHQFLCESGDLTEMSELHCLNDEPCNAPCIPLTWKNDGIVDCIDGSDEDEGE